MHRKVSLVGGRGFYVRCKDMHGGCGWEVCWVRKVTEVESLLGSVGGGIALPYQAQIPSSGVGLKSHSIAIGCSQDVNAITSPLGELHYHSASVCRC